jgi:hypothetical protein
MYRSRRVEYKQSQYPVPVSHFVAKPYGIGLDAVPQSRIESKVIEEEWTEARRQLVANYAVRRS